MGVLHMLMHVHTCDVQEDNLIWLILQRCLEEQEGQAQVQLVQVHVHLQALVQLHPPMKSINDVACA